MRLFLQKLIGKLNNGDNMISWTYAQHEKAPALLSKRGISLGWAKSRIHFNYEGADGKDPLAIHAKKIILKEGEIPPKLDCLEKRFYILQQHPLLKDVYYKINKESLQKRLKISSKELRALSDNQYSDLIERKIGELGRRKEKPIIEERVQKPVQAVQEKAQEPVQELKHIASAGDSIFLGDCHTLLTDLSIYIEHVWGDARRAFVFSQPELIRKVGGLREKNNPQGIEMIIRSMEKIIGKIDQIIKALNMEKNKEILEKYQQMKANGNKLYKMGMEEKELTQNPSKKRSFAIIAENFKKRALEWGEIERVFANRKDSLEQLKNLYLRMRESFGRWDQPKAQEDVDCSLKEISKRWADLEKMLKNDCELIEKAREEIGCWQDHLINVALINYALASNSRQNVNLTG